LISFTLFVYLPSDEALRIEQEQKEKSNRLEQRRSHLSAILEAEKNNLQV
jgi:hypothetical protein